MPDLAVAPLSCSLPTTACACAFASVAKSGLGQARSLRRLRSCAAVERRPPLVGELEEQCAARGVLSVLGRAGAVVGVTIIELSEEHGSLPGGAEEARPRPSRLPLLVSREMLRCSSVLRY
jgi:hypothetical protein